MEHGSHRHSQLWRRPGFSDMRVDLHCSSNPSQTKVPWHGATSHIFLSPLKQPKLSPSTQREASKPFFGATEQEPAPAVGGGSGSGTGSGAAILSWASFCCFWFWLQMR